MFKNFQVGPFSYRSVW